MDNFDLYILGCGSAIPTLLHEPSAQVLSLRGKNYLIDCGEGMQTSFRRASLKFSQIHAIFISHLHGDHCFGLPGLLSTLSLLGRKAALPIFGPKGIKAYVEDIQKHFLEECAYPLEVFEHSDKVSNLIYEDSSIKVTTIPLNHRVPTTGYLLEEKCTQRHINRSMTDFYKVPIAYYQYLITGEDFYTEEGTRIANEILTIKGRTPRRYAYCSDTTYHPPIIEIIKGVDLLYHEATFGEECVDRLSVTAHSSARQAGKIARLSEVKRLLIGHYSGRYSTLDKLLSEAQEEFPNTTCAKEKMVIKL